MVDWGCGREDQACIGQGVEQGVHFSAFVVWLPNICNHFCSMSPIELSVLVDG